MTYDFEKAMRSHGRSQTSHEEYIMRELRISAKSLKNTSLANQLNGFYMRATQALNGLITRRVTPVNATVI